MSACNENSENTGIKRYRILTKEGSGWWVGQRTVYANTAVEAANAFVREIGINPPNEIAVQSMARTTNGIFKMFRVKPRDSYEIEAI